MVLKTPMSLCPFSAFDLQTVFAEQLFSFAIFSCEEAKQESHHETQIFSPVQRGHQVVHWAMVVQPLCSTTQTVFMPITRPSSYSDHLKWYLCHKRRKHCTQHLLAFHS